MKSLSGYLLDIIKRHKEYFILLMIVMLVISVAEVIVSFQIKRIIDTISTNQFDNINFLFTTFVLLKLTHHFGYFLTSVLNAKYLPVLLEYNITFYLSKLSNQSLIWFEGKLSGDVSNKVADFRQSIATLVVHVPKFFRLVLTLFITMGFLWIVSKSSALIVLVFILIYSPMIFGLLRYKLRYEKNYTKESQNGIGIINDIISNISTVKIISTFKSIMEKVISPSIVRWRNASRANLKFDAFGVDLVDTVLIVVMNAVQFYFLIYSFQNGDISAGTFTFVTMTTFKLHYQLENLIVTILYDISPSYAKLKLSYDLLSEEIAVKDPENPITITDGLSGKIDFCNVSIKYNNKIAIDNLSLSIPKGAKIGIVGTSGAGKTTLIKSIMRYMDISEGEIRVGNYNIKDLKQIDLRKSISIIPQEISVLHGTIRENLLVANLNASDEDIANACKLAHIHEDILSLPDGYDTLLGEKGSRISGGQKQRLGIARAILKKSSILILDEATSSLDSKTESYIKTALDDLLAHTNTTVIAIAHRLSTLKSMDKIIVMEKGKIIESGTHEELLNKDSSYNKLWQIQIK
jgi:ATP-binding cassette subfamily B protein